MLPQPASRRDRDPAETVLETGSSGDESGAFLSSFGCDLGRERRVPGTFWERFGAQLGSKLTIFRAVDFALGTVQTQRSLIRGRCDRFRTTFHGMEEKPRYNLSGYLTAFVSGE